MHAHTYIYIFRKMTIAVKIIFFRKMTNVNNDKKEINRKEKKEDILRFTLLFRIIDILVVRIIIVRINVSYKSLYFWCILSVIVIFIRLVISMICAWCANIYIRKLRRKTCRVSFINILVDIEIWFQIFQNFLRVAENAHRAPSPLPLLLSFFILILSLSLLPSYCIPYQIVSRSRFCYSLNIIVKIVWIVENRAITIFKVPSNLCLELWNSCQHESDRYNRSTLIRGRLMLYYKSCCVNAE